MSDHIVFSEHSYDKAQNLLNQLHKHLGIDNPECTFIIKVVHGESIDVIQSVPTYTHPDGDILMIRHMKTRYNDKFDCL